MYLQASPILGRLLASQEIEDLLFLIFLFV